jgi:5-methylcytosine-specific restriction endonuclease McrA
MKKRRSTEHTRAIKEAKAIEGGVCAVCGTTEKLHGHHLFEYRLGGLPMNENIVVLCQGCHKKAHRGDFEIERIIF